ncbi:MptD family putative ECF transporter S component [Spirochaeta cellobiosiphila]|uniref:MptD family putative ECF transporter S component n=1 Tax=Spirochaeta cellobiosiphila TaxID=504483 RepID=UPI0003FF742E|nr:MptD family putative ECF transporter S component [Spirochaeta cellobiosiphila]
MGNKLTTKDLINVGLFTAIYIVVFFAVAMFGYIPMFMVALPFAIPFVGGIPFMLYLTKVKKFGMISITGVLITIFMFVTGHGWPILITGILLPVFADLILLSGKYNSWPKLVISYAVFSEWIFGAMLPMWIMRDSFIERTSKGYGDEYTDKLMSLMSGNMIIILFILAIIGSILGAYLGRKVLKKHFQRVGIA